MGGLRIEPGVSLADEPATFERKYACESIKVAVAMEDSNASIGRRGGDDRIRKLDAVEPVLDRCEIALR